MALADRDYMRERREPVPDFMPPRRKPPSMLLAVLVSCLVLAGLYIAADRYLQARDTRAATRQRAQAVAVQQQQAAAAEAAAQARQKLAPSRLFPGAPDMPAAAQALAGSSRLLTKCTGADGKVGYSDGPCARGEQRATMVVRNDVNIADGQRPAPTPAEAPRYQAPPLQRPAVVAAAPTQFDTKARCNHLDALIRQYDAEARQPQSAQMQDWITARRKEARDEQFRIRCQ